MYKNIGFLIILVFLFNSCQRNYKVAVISISSENFHNSVDKVTEIMIHDIFSPPVASRVFAYPNIAAYEIIALHNEDYITLVGQVNELTPIPLPEPNNILNYRLSAMVAHMELSKRLIFSEKRMEIFRDSLYELWRNKNPSIFKASKEYGLEVADHIGKWMDEDNYAQTRTMPQFTVNPDNKSRWQPTPPAYMEGIEPHWNKIRPFIIDSAQQFKPVPPPSFSLDVDSEFFKQLKEVYDVSIKIKMKGDNSEEVQIAKFWDCNPYVSITRGHLMFATKKITPGAHWIGITKIAARQTSSDFDKTVYAYARTALGISDAFISCWDEKYRSDLVRPETLINEYIDDSWQPVLQTPPFPEYTSGHSVVSAAASTILTDIFGEKFAFDDDTEVAYGLPIRSFDSFSQAAEEAAISRMYGGIHYRDAVELGLVQGRLVAQLIIERVSMRKNK